MATVTLESEGEKLSDKSASLTYICEGYDSLILARDAAHTTAPASYDGYPKKPDYKAVAAIKDWDKKVFVVEIPFGTGGSAEPAVNDESMSFNIANQTLHITTSLSTVNTYSAPGKFAPDFKGSINVGANGEVRGVDIKHPVLSFTKRKIFSSAQVDDAYMQTLRDRVGTVNDATFEGLDAGEVLMESVTGSTQEDDSWELNYTFLVSPNETGLTVGPVTGIAKDGWDYLWVFNDDYEDTTNYRMASEPLGAYVERVFRREDYSALGL